MAEALIPFIPKGRVSHAYVRIEVTTVPQICGFMRRHVLVRLQCCAKLLECPACATANKLCSVSQGDCMSTDLKYLM